MYPNWFVSPAHPHFIITAINASNNKKAKADVPLPALRSSATALPLSHSLRGPPDSAGALVQVHAPATTSVAAPATKTCNALVLLGESTSALAGGDSAFRSMIKSMLLSPVTKKLVRR